MAYSKLIVANGESKGLEIPLTNGEIVIGRGHGCKIRPMCWFISRWHCALTVSAGEVRVRDLVSRNGTYVNGERIRVPKTLANGDSLRIGSIEFHLATDAGLADSDHQVHLIEVVEVGPAHSTEADIDHYDEADLVDIGWPYGRERGEQQEVASAGRS